MASRTRRRERIAAPLVLALLLAALATGSACAAYSQHAGPDPAHAAQMGAVCVFAHAEADALPAQHVAPRPVVSEVVLLPIGVQAIAWAKPIDHPPRV